MARGRAAEKGKILERQLLALDLRKAGYSYRAIGSRLGVSHVQAYKDVQDELKRLAALNLDRAEELRQLELERLDKIIRSLDHWIEAGSAQAVMAALKAMDTRAKLLGLYAPEKHEIKDWRTQAIEDIRAGKLHYEDLANAFDTGLAAELFEASGVPISSGQSADDN